MSRFENLEDSTRNNSIDVVNDEKWHNIFPACVASPDKSNQFMGRAMFVAFSIVLAKRKLLPDECFSVNYITDNLKIKSLNFQNEKALAITQLLKHCGEAIKLGYLDELALVITGDKEDDEALEVFSFKLHYFLGGEVAARMTSQQSNEYLTEMKFLKETSYDSTMAVRDQLLLMSRSIMVLCLKVLQPLPEKFSTTFRVKYTNAAPADFEINGFATVPSFYTLDKDIQSVSLGQLRPGHHGGLFNCSSICINDASHAVTTIRKYMEKYVKEMGLSYTRVSNDGTTRSSSNGETTILPTATSISGSPRNGSVESSPDEKKTRAKSRRSVGAPYTTIRRRS